MVLTRMGVKKIVIDNREGGRTEPENVDDDVRIQVAFDFSLNEFSVNPSRGQDRFEL